MEKAILLDIQRMSTEDGPGIRTTVFFKGCSLKCTWCHNPESIDFKPIVLWQKERCIHCGSCVLVCPHGAISMPNDVITIDRALCERCGTCVVECPTNALVIKGKSYSVDSLVTELLKDKGYFGTQGGVTLSGGEVLAQSAFAVELLKRLKVEGVHTAVDTAGMVPYTALSSILPYTDLVLFDLKIMDSKDHEHWVGAPNEIILANLERAVMETGSWSLWIRTPIIPGATDSETNIRAIANYIREKLHDKVSRWELCAFNNLCKNKYQMLGIDWSFAKASVMRKDTMNHLVEAAQDELLNKEIVRWTGIAD